MIVLVGWLTADQIGRPRIARDPDAGAATTDAAVAIAPAASADSGAGTAATGTSEAPTDGGLGLGSLGSLLGDSGPMPTGAPRAVRLGVVLVQYAGAEGASSTARAKPDALEHARRLAEQARTDWKAAVKAGDSGSSEDIGRIPRGVLDARTEVAVFSMSKDDISEPLETPRGYWIVKRVE